MILFLPLISLFLLCLVLLVALRVPRVGGSKARVRLKILGMGWNRRPRNVVRTTSLLVVSGPRNVVLRTASFRLAPLSLLTTIGGGVVRRPCLFRGYDGAVS